MRIILACISLIAVIAQRPAYAADFLTSGIPLAKVNVPVKSLMEIRFQNVVRQQYDFSCGSAALATLLTYHYQEPVDEKTLLKEMYEVGDQEKIRRVGFSLLDMKTYLNSRGFAADGYRVSLNRMREAGVPAIVLLNNRGYMHFVVVKGITAHRVLLGDPAVGLKTMTREDFEKGWNGIAFIINDVPELARAHFNRLDEWKLKHHSIAASDFDMRSLSRSALDATPTPNYF